jgi:catechol 2,3-dioxygenase-like lactoylglutathione lyase family enzyme
VNDTIKSLGDVMQIAYIPADFDAAVKFWTETMGVGPFYRAEHCQTAMTRSEFRGQPTDIDFSIMLAYWGDIQVELIELHNDAPSVYTEWRRSGAEGMHHICILTEDMDHVKDVCARAGFTLLQDGDTPGGNFAYFDTHGGPGTILEVLHPQPATRAYQEHMKEVARTWDGTRPVREFGD